MVSALIFLAPGFEEIETVTIIDIFRRAGINVVIAGLSDDIIEGAHSIKIMPDTSINEIKLKNFDALVVPGGNPGYKNLRNNQKVIELIREAAHRNIWIGAICAAPAVLSDAGILKGNDCTIYPGMEDQIKSGGGNPKRDLVVIDRKIITSRGPATALPFALKLVEKLVNKQVAKDVSKKTLANLLKF